MWARARLLSHPQWLVTGSCIVVEYFQNHLFRVCVSVCVCVCDKCIWCHSVGLCDNLQCFFDTATWSADQSWYSTISSIALFPLCHLRSDCFMFFRKWILLEIELPTEQMDFVVFLGGSQLHFALKLPKTYKRPKWNEWNCQTWHHPNIAKIHQPNAFASAFQESNWFFISLSENE